MSRLILLELDDREVDVLSRLPGWGPRENILVVHSDPRALIRGLAALAEIASADAPPSPQVDDEVVVTEKPGPHVRGWIEGWRTAGAEIITASAYRPVGGRRQERPAGPPAPAEEKTPSRAAADGASLPHPAVERPVPAAVAEREERERRVSIMMNARGGEPAPGNSREATAASADEEAVPRREPPAAWVNHPSPAPGKAPAPSETAPATPAVERIPLDVWTNPEATFCYLLGARAGEAVLWWDGAGDVWVPWLSFGAPAGGEGPPEDALEIPAHYGRFRLAGTTRGGDALLLPALARVADDLALRDLAEWRRTEDRLIEHRIPAPGDALPVIRGWGERVLEALGADASFVWRETGDSAWELAAARGEGVRFTGELRLADRVLASLFDVGNGTWCTWSAGFGIRLDASAPAADPRWPLRFSRVKRAALGERNARG